jgi:hypothetical protein
MYKILSTCFGFGLIGAVICTWVAPRVISILFTPPVSFGTNCEPAAAWATDKLITSQIGGMAIGFLLAGVWLVSRKLKKSNTKEIAAAKA